MQPTAPNDILRRYRKVYDQVSMERGWRNLRHLPTDPYDSSYPKAEIFIGGHVDQDPDTEDWVEVWSEKPEPSTGKNLILKESFVQGTERHWFKKRNVLHHYAMQIRSPGGSYLDAVLSTIDVDTGEVLRTLSGKEAFEFGGSRGLDDVRHPQAHHAPPDRPRVASPPPSPFADRLPHQFQGQQRDRLLAALGQTKLSEPELSKVIALVSDGDKFEQGLEAVANLARLQSVGLGFDEAYLQVTGIKSGLAGANEVSFEGDAVWVGDHLVPKNG